MKQFTIYENKVDEKPDWSRLRNADLSDISKAEFQGLPPFEFSAPAVESTSIASNFKGAWFPSLVDSTHIDLTAGSFLCGSLFTPTVTNISVHATSLNYIYLRATLSGTYTDSYTTGGSATAVSIISSTTTLTSDNTYGYILLCTWQASALVARYEWYSFSASLQNSGVGDILFVYWNS